MRIKFLYNDPACLSLILPIVQNRFPPVSAWLIHEKRTFYQALFLNAYVSVSKYYLQYIKFYVLYEASLYVHCHSRRLLHATKMIHFLI